MRVADNGIGVDPQHAERIFKMFQRLHTRDDFPGTGIGLAVEPTPGGGATFCFTLAAAPRALMAA